NSLGAARRALLCLCATRLAPARRISSKGVSAMAELEDSSQPRLAVGCRWTGERENRTLVYPEGALRLQETARAILERCDGQRSFAQIVAELVAAYNASDPAKIRQEASVFLERLRQKRLVDY